MILELLSTPLTWGLGTFVIVCAWHNYKVGRLAGIAEGVDVALTMLSNEKLIDLEHGQDGEIIIHAIDGSAKKKTR
jgi:hypothetical protein